MFGIIKPRVDAHTLGICTVQNLLNSCGIETIITEYQSASEVIEWIRTNNISELGFSYRLDPYDALTLFTDVYSSLDEQISQIFFAGLPESCALISEKHKDVITFSGDESPLVTLTRCGVRVERLPRWITQEDAYDTNRFAFAEEIVQSGRYKSTAANYNKGNSLIARLEYAKTNGNTPLIRAHAGPYNENKTKAIEEFCCWTTELAHSRYLDVLSIGSSQLSQECFGEDWGDKPNGGGVPINSVSDYKRISVAADGMLVRTYAGTSNIRNLAQMYEESLDIAWHALSFWWFSEIDGRGKNTVYDNLKEHFETIRYISTTGKPLEPNVSHHFAFRGSDDVSCIIAGFLANKAAKLLGIKYLVLQCMFNNPKHTTGVHDIAKARVLLNLTRELEDNDFTVIFQTRTGLDYLSTDVKKSKIQLASATALMDDVEPWNDNSPQIVHVVSYSEANNLATPEVINESIQITLFTLSEYRKAKMDGVFCFDKYAKEIIEIEKSLYEEAKEAITFLEENINELYSPEGFLHVFEQGYFPLPFLLDVSYKYPRLKDYSTMLINGGVFCVDSNGNKIRTIERYKHIFARKNCSV